MLVSLGVGFGLLVDCAVRVWIVGFRFLHVAWFAAASLVIWVCCEVWFWVGSLQYGLGAALGCRA